MKALFISMLFILGSVICYSQPFGQEWASRYNGTANSVDWAYAVTTDNSDNVYVTGYSTNIGTGKDMLTIKYDPSGNILWSRSYNGPVNGGDYSFSIAVDNSGNVYITGRSDQGATYSDYTTIKYNSNGVQQWIALYNGTAGTYDEGRVVAVDNSGNVYVTGKSMGINSDYDITTIKYDQNGNQVWVQRYNGPGNSYDGPNSMYLDAAGNIYIAGESIGIGSDYVTIKYNSNGVQQWVNRYNGTNSGGDAAVAVKTDNNGNVFVTGTSDQGATSYDYATIKYNSAGVQQWIRTYDDIGHRGDFATAMDLDQNGNVYVTGKSSGSSVANDSDFATVKYNTNGDQIWVALYAGPNNSSDVSRAIVVDHLGNIIVTGSSGTLTQTDYVTIKYNPAGVQQWIGYYNGTGSGNDFTSSLAIDNSNNIFVTGKSLGAGTDYDYATIKYAVLTGIIPVSGNIPDKFNLSQNYPNPFNPETKIRFSIPSAGNVSIVVFDILGHELSSIVNSYLNPGNYEVNYDASKLPSGVYFYKISSGSFSDVKKMILAK